MGVSAGKLCVARRGILLQDNIELVELFLLGKNFFRQRLRLLLLRRLWGPRRGSLPGCVRAKGVVAVATWMRAGVSCVDVEVDRRGRMGGLTEGISRDEAHCVSSLWYELLTKKKRIYTYICIIYIYI